MFESGSNRLPFLYGLAASREKDAQRLVLRIAVDQFMARDAHAPAAIRRFENEIRPMIEDCGMAARLIAARKLCGHATPPVRILDFIAELGGEGEIFVLTHAPRLSRKRLEAAAWGETASARALSGRADLDGELVDRLVLRNERTIALALAGNASAPLDAATLARWAPSAERDAELAQALLARAAPNLDQAPLFFAASPEQRRALLAAAQRAELAQPRAAQGPRRAREAVAMLEGLALSDEKDLFVAALALALRCRESLALKIVNDPSGEALAVALAALELSRDSAMRILISGDLRSGAGFKRISALIRLKDALSPSAAQRFIAAMAGERMAPRALHAPQLDPTAAPTPSRAAPARRVAPMPAAKVRSA